MMTRILSPRGLGAIAATLAALAMLGALVALPLAARLLTGGTHLGETGQDVFDALQGFQLLLALYLGGLAVLLLDLRGAASTLDRRSAGWRRTAAATAVLLGIVALEWLIGFGRSYLLILGPGPEYYNRAEWLGLPLLVSNEPYSLTDFFTSLFLLLAAATAGGAYLRLSTGEARSLLPRELFALFATGFGYLALDEYLTIHEFLGANVPVLKEVTFVGHPDDLVMLIYFGLGGLVLLRYIRPLLQDRVGVAIMAAAVVLQGLAAAGDAWFPPSLWRLEEISEVLAAGCYFLFVVRYSVAPPAMTRADRAREENRRLEIARPLPEVASEASRPASERG